MISPLASIHPNAKIAEGVIIDPFAVVQEEVEIGEGTWIASNAVIYNGSKIGKNCKIHSGAVIGGAPQDLKYAGEKTTCEIGDNTVVRECVTVNRGTTDRMTTVVGSNVLLMAYAHVAHDCIIKDHVILANATQVGGHCIIDEYAIIGGTSAVHQFCKVGKHVMVAGGAKIVKDVPPYALVTRITASFCGVNAIGLRRRGFSNDEIREVQKIYKHIYNEGRNISQAKEFVKESIVNSAVKEEVLNFIENSDRGLVRFSKEDFA